MSNVDHIILEVADDRRHATSTMDVWVNWPTEKAERPTYNHLNRRVRVLAEHEMLEPAEKRGWYRLAELGDRYLHDPDAEISDFVDEDEGDGSESDDE